MLGGVQPMTPTIVPEASILQIQSPPLARTTAVIFQLVLLQGGVWVGAEGYPLREPLWKLGGVSLAWVLELSAWPP